MPRSLFILVISLIWDIFCIHLLTQTDIQSYVGWVSYTPHCPKMKMNEKTELILILLPGVLKCPFSKNVLESFSVENFQSSQNGWIYCNVLYPVYCRNDGHVHCSTEKVSVHSYKMVPLVPCPIFKFKRFIFLYFDIKDYTIYLFG